MKSLTESNLQEKHKLFTANPWLLLMEITIGATTYYYTSDLSNTVIGATTYVPRAINADYVRETLSGEVPKIRVQVDNCDLSLAATLSANSGGIGGTVVLKVVNANLLTDTVPISETFTILETDADAQWITFSIGLANPFTRRFPRDRYVGTLCRHRFRGALCRYTGGTYTSNTIGFVTSGTSNYISVVFNSASAAVVMYNNFAAGQTITVSGSDDNDGKYIINMLTVQTDIVKIYFTEAYYPLTQEIAGNSITITAICDHTLTACRANDNEIYFGASPGIAEGVFG